MSDYRDYLQGHLFLIDHELEVFSPWTGHIAFAQWLIDCVRPRLLVGLGVDNGVSHCAFCQGVKKAQSGTACYGIDSWKGEADGREGGSTVLSELRDYHDVRYATFSQLQAISPDQAASSFKDRSIDLLHIDGMADEAAVQRTFEMWQPKLSDRAIVLFHDINRPDDKPESLREALALQDVNWRIEPQKHRFWDDLRVGRPHFSFYHGYGLGVLGWGADLPEEIRRLFQAGEEPQAWTRSYFSALTRPWVERGVLLAENKMFREASFQERSALARYEEHLCDFPAHFDEFNAFFKRLVRYPSKLAKRIHKNTPKGIRTMALRRQERADIAYLRQTKGFDETWYRRTYAHTLGSSSDAIRHYVEHGERLGFQPNALFTIEPYIVKQYQKALFSGNYYAACLKEKAKLEKRCARNKTRLSPAIEIPFESEIDHEPAGSIAVICHCYYVELAEELLSYLKNLRHAYFLYISTDKEEKKAHLEQILKAHDLTDFEIRICENRGRDIAPKLVTFQDVYAKHPYFLFLHTKKSLHMPEFGVKWRRYLYSTLLGTPEIIRSILQILDQPGVGIVYPCHIEKLDRRNRWGLNFRIAQNLLQRLNIKVSKWTPLYFPAGSMFWGRSAAIQPLVDLRLTFADFEEEGGHLDGTLSHAIERSICLVAENAHFIGQQIILKGHDIEEEEPIQCRDLKELPEAMRRCRQIQRRARVSHFIKRLTQLKGA